MQNYIQAGETLDIVLTADTTSGGVVVVGDMVGVASNAGEIGDTIAVALEGVFELPKGNAALTLGKRVYWDATNSVVVATATGNVQAGYVAYAAAADATVVAVKLVAA